MMVCLSVNIRKFFTLKNNPDKAKSKYWLADENTHTEVFPNKNRENNDIKA